jgi:hypothetical protein
VFWDELNLIGASTVASIEQWLGTKNISRCPRCASTNIASRKTRTPRFRCDDCHEEFETPIVTKAEVTHYRTDHEQGWVDLAGLLDGATLRKFTGYSQNSIRRLDWGQFASAIDAAAGSSVLNPVNIVQLRHWRRPHQQAGERADRPTRFPSPPDQKVRVSVRIFRIGSCGGARSLPPIQLRRDWPPRYRRWPTPAARSAPLVRSGLAGSRGRREDRRSRSAQVIRVVRRAARPTLESDDHRRAARLACTALDRVEKPGISKQRSCARLLATRR